MVTSLRHFARFGCDIKLYLSVAGKTITQETSFEFISAYSLKQISICCRVNKFMPTRFCRAELNFYIIEPEVPRDNIPWELHMSNYDRIVAMAIRNIIYVLSINNLIYEFKEEGLL